MAQNQMQGLFTGPGVNDVYARQRQERDQKVRQAMADSAGAGGNFYANLQAKANEQMSQAFQGGVRGLLQGTDLAPAEDPRLAAARKREGDRNEINEMLAGFKADDGKISEDELRKGYAELMSRGYPQEAASFLQQAQSMRKLDIDATKAITSSQAAATAARYGLKSTDKIGEFEDTNGRKFNKYVKFNKDNTQETVVIPWDGDSNKPAEGELSPLGPKGLTSKKRVGELDDIDTNETAQIKRREDYKSALKIGEDEAKAVLDRRTAELQRDNNLSLDKAKQRAGAELITEREYIKGGIAATEALPKAEELLAIVTSGDYTGGKATAAFKSFKRLFNIEGTDDASFRTGTQMMLLKLLKPLMGAKATDQDLIELKDALANPMQSTEANKVILERFIKQIKKDKKAGKYFASDDKATLGGWFIKQDQFSLLGTVPTPQAQRRVGEMIRKDGEAYKWNGTTWDKQ